MPQTVRSPCPPIVLVLSVGLFLFGRAPAPLAAEPPAAADTPGEHGVDLGSRVQAIFAAKCYKCHGPTTHKAELNLSTPAGIAKGSESGPIVAPGDLDESLLYEMVHEGYMPPEDEGEPVTPEEVETIRRWIVAGAEMTDSDAAAATDQVTQHEVLPVLRLRCTVCHGGRRREAELDLRTVDSILAGGKSGPAIVPGKPDESLLLAKVRAGEMPPRLELVTASVKPMTDVEVDVVARWIAAGAPVSPIEPDVATTEPDPLVQDEDRRFWAFQPPRAAVPPAVTHADQVINPIDAFLLEQLESAGLAIAPEPDRLTLMRRAYYDLIGLPPAPAEVAAYLADDAPDAYERLVDRLLDSPRYGERWGRYWLDLAGYSDSEGVQNKDLVRREAYRYRDYVIRALNNDKPYDRFLLEQIAGDELADYEHAPKITPELYDNLVATGFLRMTADGTYSPITNFVTDRLAIIADEIAVLSSSVMGLTIKCARCHSHKFDPIPQRDYYRLAAVLKGAYDEHDWLVPEPRSQPERNGVDDRYLAYVTSEERNAWLAHEAQIDADIDALHTTLAEHEAEAAARHLDALLAPLPDVLHDDLRAMLATPPADRGEVERYLAARFEAQLRPTGDALAELDAEFKQAREEAQKQIDALNHKRKPQPLVRALWDRGEPSPTYLLVRGNHLTPGRPVGPGVPSVLTDGRTPLEIAPPWPGSHKTGRRLALARWLTRPDHPLTARVMVNRMWRYHFGRGIVATLDNFGKAGARPTHPELLDWLAVRFVEDGWSIKAMHRLMMTSRAYRQTSQVTPERKRLDPENALWSRMPLRRLDGEALRDTLLAVAGRLDLTPFGPADGVDARDDGLVTSRGSERGWRRSVYVLQRRTQPLTLLENFDLPPMNPNCIERSESTVAPQALHLMNNEMIQQLAAAFADRVRAEAGSDPGAQIRRAFQIARGREPDDEEYTASTSALDALTAQWVDDLRGRRRVIEATAHLWIRESAPTTVYENDLISVWSSTSRDHARRYGLVEFDVGDLEGFDLSGAHLELGVLNREPLRQAAALVPPGIDAATWESYMADKSAAAVPLDSLGRVELGEGEGTIGGYVQSFAASPRDLELLASRIAADGRVTLVFVADEDGQSYSRDWDDGAYHESRDRPPRLVLVDSTPDVDEARRRALVNYCHAVLNSAGLIYVD